MRRVQDLLGSIFHLYPTTANAKATIEAFLASLRLAWHGYVSDSNARRLCIGTQSALLTLRMFKINSRVDIVTRTSYHDYISS